MKCEDLLKALNAYVDGQVDPAICDEFAKHLAGCDPCQVVVDNIRGTIALYRNGKPYEMPREFHERMRHQLREKWSTVFGNRERVHSTTTSDCCLDTTRTTLQKGHAMLIKIATKKPLQETAVDLQTAVQKHRFGVMQVHNLKETMVKKGVEFDPECMIYEVCQPQQAKKVLEQSMSLSTMLPCRISLFEEGGQTVMATLKPTALVGLFNEPSLVPVAQEVEDTLVKIMTDAASPAQEPVP